MGKPLKPGALQFTYVLVSLPPEAQFGYYSCKTLFTIVNFKAFVKNLYVVNMRLK